MLTRSSVLASILVASIASVSSVARADEPAQPASIQTQLGALIGRQGGLTSDRAAARARATSYDVQAKQAEMKASGALVDAAVENYVPRISARASYMRLSHIPDLDFSGLGIKGPPLAWPLNSTSLSAQLVVPVSDYVLKIGNQYAQASHSAQASKAMERAAELNASSNARILYYSWARARLEVVVAEAALVQANLHLGDVKSEFDAGRASQADVLSVQSRVAASQLLVQRAHDLEALVEDRLRTALHDEGSKYEIGEPLLDDLAPLPGESDFASIYSEALSQRAEIRALGESAAAMREQVKATRATWLPKLEGLASAEYANPNSRYFPPTQDWNGTWAVGGAISWNATEALTGHAQGRSDEAKAVGLEAQRLQMRDGVRDEVMGAFQAVHDAELAIVTSQTRLSAAEEAYRVRRALFKNDRATSTELTDAEKELTDARFEVVGTRIDLRVARVRLVHAVGRDDVSAQK